MDNVAQLETDTNFQSRKKITWGVFSVLYDGNHSTD